jgi:hypothetical protein
VERKIGKKMEMYAGISYTFNQDDVKAGMKDANKNEVILPGLEFKTFTLDLTSNYFNGKLIFERRLKGISMIVLAVNIILVTKNLVTLFTTGKNLMAG